MLFKPNFVFKYKGIYSNKDLERCIEIVKDFRIFLPNISQLNDPMESGSAYIQPTYAGATIYSTVERACPEVQSAQKKFRILSLSEQWDSPQMWAHYANNYNGFCFVFNTDSAFKDVQPVIYTNNRFIAHDPGVDELDQYVHDSLLFKQKDWANEYEWRIIRKLPQEGASSIEYLEFEQSDLYGIIMGNNMNSDQTPNKDLLKEFIALCEEKKIPVWRAYPTTVKIHITPLNFAPELSGALLAEQIQEAYKQNNTRPFIYY